MYLCDYHLHSSHSTDAVNSIVEMCSQAVKIGLNEIAITDHFEPTLGDEEHRAYDPYKSWMEIERCRIIFKDILKIRFGIELGQPHHFPFSSLKLVTSFPFDYILASSHKFRNGIDVSELNFAEWKIEELCEVYLKELKSLIQWGNFNCVGHLDLIKRYCTNHYQQRISLANQQTMLEEVLRLLVSKGKGLEINTSGLRQSPKETLPGFDVLKLYRSLGGEILTVGSDAHNVNDLGKNIPDAYELAKEAGFKYITTFENRRPIWIPLFKGQMSLRMIT